VLDGEPLTCERVKSEVERVFAEHGAQADEFIVAHGAQTAIGHELGHGAIVPGEAIVFDLFPRDRRTGVFTDMTRTYVVGEPPAELAEWHRLCK
jgi:Xaa-Pro aminopeptidase